MNQLTEKHRAAISATAQAQRSIDETAELEKMLGLESKDA